ncbi:hypothetical protein [Archangium primigenium]|uniref:hypothetical protein n=1 Tax=[Archangium] primigenium TaxID=2792470 RepID=UPI00195C79C3|nr:hypothetical protein [Archangium primigenium]MBM7115383.1 hypothetical protein [Archangium primigenium]
MNPPRAWLSHAGRRVTAFVSAPVSPQPLGVLRIGVALVLLLQAWSLADHLTLLFGDRGLAPWSLSEPMASRWIPRLGTVVPVLQQWGLSARACIAGLAALYALGLVGLLLGWRTRVCAVGVWILHTILVSSGTLLVYGLETFAHISLFYCAIMPVGAAFSLDRRAGRVSGEPSPHITLSLRVLQVHLCLMYFMTGFEKALGEPWQQGDALWRILMQPQYSRYDFAWLASVPWLTKALSWGTLVVEMGYPFFVWSRRTGAFWVVFTLGLHAGIAVFMGLWMFGGIMGVLTFAAFGWERFEPLLSRLVRPRSGLLPSPGAPERVG